VRRLLFTPAAEEDLEQIWTYTVSEWGRQQAETYVRDLQSRCRALVLGQVRVRSAEHIRSGYKTMISGKHILFFQETEADVIIVRILHQKMVPDRHL